MAVPIRVLACAELLNIFDGDEGMGVHRVVMVEIADYQGIDGGEFREDANKDPLGVHGAEGVGGVGCD